MWRKYEGAQTAFWTTEGEQGPVLFPSYYLCQSQKLLIENYGGGGLPRELLYLELDDRVSRIYRHSVLFKVACVGDGSRVNGKGE